MDADAAQKLLDDKLAEHGLAARGWTGHLDSAVLNELVRETGARSHCHRCDGGVVVGSLSERRGSMASSLNTYEALCAWCSKPTGETVGTAAVSRHIQRTGVPRDRPLYCSPKCKREAGDNRDGEEQERARRRRVAGKEHRKHLEAKEWQDWHDALDKKKQDAEDYRTRMRREKSAPWFVALGWIAVGTPLLTIAGCVASVPKWWAIAAIGVAGFFFCLFAGAIQDGRDYGYKSKF